MVITPFTFREGCFLCGGEKNVKGVKRNWKLIVNQELMAPLGSPYCFPFGRFTDNRYGKMGL